MKRASRASLRLKKQLCEAMQAHLATGKSPTLPEAGRLLWGFYGDLAATRTWHNSGPNPISYGEIEAWSRLHRWPLEPHHVEIIKAMDSTWLEHTYATMRGQRDGVKSIPKRSSQAMNPAAFDAVFG